MHMSSDEDAPEPGPFPTGISVVEASVRGRLFDGGDDEEGEPILFGLVRLARFVPATTFSPSTLLSTLQLRGEDRAGFAVRAARTGPAMRQTRSYRTRLSARSTKCRSLSPSIAAISMLNS